MSKRSPVQKTFSAHILFEWVWWLPLVGGVSRPASNSHVRQHRLVAHEVWLVELGGQVLDHENAPLALRVLHGLEVRDEPVRGSTGSSVTQVTGCYGQLWVCVDFLSDVV